MFGSGEVTAKFGLEVPAMKSADSLISSKREEFGFRCHQELVNLHREEHDAKMFFEHPWPVVKSALMKELGLDKADWQGGRGGGAGLGREP